MCTYILELQGNHYYVGRTTSTTRRWRQHWTGKGAKWLDLHPPVRVKEVWKGDRERELTLQYMREFGWENVRGSVWCARQIKEPIELWFEEMASQQLQDIDINQWCIQPAQKNSYNATYWPITATKDSKAHPKLQIGGDDLTLRVPFGITQYGDTTTTSRSNLDYSVPPWMTDYKDFLMRVDRMIVDHVWEHRQEFFKKPPSSKEVLQEMYCPILQEKEKYDDLFRTKVNSSFPVFCVQDEGPPKRGKRDDIVAGSSCVPIVAITKIWTMSGRFGCSAITEAVMVWPNRQEKEISDLFVTALGARSQDESLYPAT